VFRGSRAVKQRTKAFFGGGLLALGLFGIASAGQLEDGMAAFRRGDYATAMSLWRPLVDQGDADAQYNLGVMYWDGQGVSQDYAQAVAWFRKAADQGLAGAQFNLGLAYAKGQGVPQDYTQAHMWLNLSASRALDDTVRRAAVIHREELAAKMTPEQIAEAQRMAREWAPKGASGTAWNSPPMDSPTIDTPPHSESERRAVHRAAQECLERWIKDGSVKCPPWPKD